MISILSVVLLWTSVLIRVGYAAHGDVPICLLSVEDLYSNVIRTTSVSSWLVVLRYKQVVSELLFTASYA